MRGHYLVARISGAIWGGLFRLGFRLLLVVVVVLMVVVVAWVVIVVATVAKPESSFIIEIEAAPRWPDITAPTCGRLLRQ